MSADLDRSWLVQRLKKPTRPTIFGADNPFAFGGGLKNGGLSSEAMTLLRSIFSFDYMGAAEFEWGAVPKALQSLADNKSLAAFTFDVALADIAPHWKDKGAPAPEGTASVYVLCPSAWSEDVQQRITSWAAEGYTARLKESLDLSTTLHPHNEWDGETVGWLELDNGFMFFTDRTMWEQTCTLFGVEAQVSA